MKLIVVTDRRLAGDSFVPRMEAVARSRPDAIILREKDMEEDDLRVLADVIGMSCRFHDVRLIINGFVDVAKENGVAMQLPMDVLRRRAGDLKNDEFGASVHSIDELREAVSYGARWVVFGNVFETTSKPGKLAAGTDMLEQICRTSPVPVYAIGGITPANAALCRDAGAAGICVRSPYMICDDPEELTEKFRLALQRFTKHMSRTASHLRRKTSQRYDVNPVIPAICVLRTCHHSQELQSVPFRVHYIAQRTEI